MAEYGMIVRNLYRSIQIDSQYVNFSVYDYGTANLVEGSNLIAITPSSDPMFIIVKPVTDAAVIPIGLYEDSGQYTHIIIAANGVCSVPWILLKSGASQPEPDYGLVVSDATGNITFSSGELGYARILKVSSFGVTGNVGVLNTNNYFFITSNYAAHSGTALYVKGIKKYDSEFVTIESVKISDTGGGGGAGSSGATSYIQEFKTPPSI